MAIIYGNAISIGYATSGSSVGGTYSIWLTLPTIATLTAFTAVKDGVSVESEYISSIGAAKVTLPADNPEGDWTITGTVGGKTVSKTVTVKSGTVDYFVDFRNDFIPLVGDLAVGNLVTFDNKEWRVVHQEGTHWYLGYTKINNLTIYGKTTAFTQATIFESATNFKDTLSAQALEYICDVNIEGTPCTVWIPSEDELNGGFSYFTGTNSELYDKRKREFGTSGNMAWWTRSNRSAGGFYKRYVTSTGRIDETSSLDTSRYGFVPFICIKYYPIGFDFTYTGNCNIRKDGVIEFLTSGDFISSETLNIDAFLVGGGASGSGGDNANNVKYAGGGGSGGYTLTKKNISIAANNIYNIQIGAGGIATVSSSALTTSAIRPGEDTTAFGFTASGGQSNSSTSTSTAVKRITGGDGGCGGGSGSASTNNSNGTGGSNGNNGGGSYGGKGQGNTPREFGESTGKLYAGGGGGGQYSNSPVNKGGEGGGGNGANSGNAATVGTPNTGGGGGGGSVSPNYNGASGGSGIVCIRKTKPQFTDIPLTGDLAVGNTVTFDDKSFVVVHNEGTKWYLASSTIIEECTSTVLTTKCTEYLSNFSSTAQNYMVAQTIDSYTGKVFLPSRAQLNSGFTYYKNNANRICRYNGEASYWWALTSSSSGYNDSVDSDGAISSNHYSVTLGFRPHICIDTSLSGSATEDNVTLAGTWLLNNTLYPTEAKLTEKIDVTHAGSKYTSIVIDPISNRCVTLTAGVGGKTLYYFDTKRWNGSDHTIIFSEGTTCSDEFFTWLKANATKQS